MPRQLIPKMNQAEALGAAIALTDEILEILEEGEFERVGELEKKHESARIFYNAKKHDAKYT